MRTYLLTGATGVLGSALLAELLCESDCQVHLLVRAVGGQEPAQRIKTLLARIGVAPEWHSGRVHALLGDACQPLLGVSAEDYAVLSSTVTHIIHCAGNVKSNLPAEQAERIAVDSVSSIITLAKACQRVGVLEKVEIVSTIGVGGRAKGVVRETWVDPGQEFHNSYEWAKAQAEYVVRHAMGDGIPVTVHRPSMIVGSSSTGAILHFQVFYYICDFLSGSRTAGYLPDFGQASLDIVPVDHVARAIVWSSGSRKTKGAILHLCAGAERTVALVALLGHVRDAYQRHGLNLPATKLIPRWLFKGLLPLATALSSGRDQRRIRTLHFFLDYLAEDIRFDTERTDKLLRESGIELPAVSSYIGPVLDYYLKHR